MTTHREALVKALGCVRDEGTMTGVQLRGLLTELIAVGDRGRFRRHKDSGPCFDSHCMRAHLLIIETDRREGAEVTRG